MALKIEYETPYGITCDEKLSNYVARMNQKYGSCITEIGGWEWPIQP